MRKRKIKNNIWIDSVLATIFIYLFMLMLFLISKSVVFDALDPISEALADMEMTDYAFSKLRDPLPPDTSIVLINMGPLDRAGIAQQLQIVDKYEPAVIGMDSFFKGYLGDTLGSLSLSFTIANLKSKLVMASMVKQSDSLSELYNGEELYDVYYQSDSMFRTGDDIYEGLVNLDTEAQFQDDIKICRAFPPQREVIDDQKYIAFAAQLAYLFDSTSLNPLLTREKEFEIINYRGDFVNFFEEDKFSTRFYALDWDQVLREDFVPGLLKDKIILFGYLGEEFGAAQWEDKFFTPLNPKIAGRANPDMFGPVIHANIISMIINRDYVDRLDPVAENVIGLILCYLNVVLFSLIYRKMGAWYDGLTKLIQVAEVLIILFLIIYIFSWRSFKLELTVGLFAIALAGDLLEVYYSIVLNVVLKLRNRISNKRTELVERDN